MTVGKTLSEPLLLFEVPFGMILFLQWRAARGFASRPLRRLTASLAILFCVLVAMSLPAVAALLERLISMPPAPAVVPFTPDAVVVLSAGYGRGAAPELDVLSEETMARVVRGVAAWKQFPRARLILSGEVPKKGRADSRLAELMAELAVCRGVPREAIVLEPASLRTRDHPRSVLRLPGVTRSTPLLIVSSDDHLRRALFEFRRYFDRVAWVGTHGTMPFSGNWRAWCPSASALWQSSAVIHEALGIVDYRLLPRSGE